MFFSVSEIANLTIPLSSQNSTLIVTEFKQSKIQEKNLCNYVVCALWHIQCKTWPTIWSWIFFFLTQIALCLEEYPTIPSLLKKIYFCSLFPLVIHPNSGWICPFKHQVLHWCFLTTTALSLASHTGKSHRLCWELCLR